MITGIKVRDFRRFQTLNIPITSRYVAIIGLNGIGKTTLLEAIALISITKSHRSSNLKDLIRFNQDFALIEATTNKSIVRMVISPTGKTITVDGSEVKKISSYVGRYPAILFTPGDLDIVYGSPGGRRRFLNQEISQLKPVYMHELNSFQELLMERNAFLKANDNPAFLEVITAQLIDIQERIIPIRESFVKELNVLAAEVFTDLSNGQKLEIKYLKSLPDGKIREFYAQRLAYDLQTSQTNHGIHRDDLQFHIDGQDASKFASQGQVRLLVLSIKIALVKLIYKFKNAYPILLLDDVLSELDAERQKRLMEMIVELGQVFITSTDFKIKNDLLKKFQLIELSKGLVNNGKI